MAAEPVIALAAAGAGPAASGARIVELAPAGAPASATPQLEARFQASLARAGAVEGTLPAGAVPPPVKGLFDALDQINVQARTVSDYAKTAETSGGQLTPGEMIHLTMKCQEFMFQAQLTSNIANRSAEGIQQLFRQQ